MNDKHASIEECWELIAEFVEISKFNKLNHTNNDKLIFSYILYFV